MKLLLSLSTLIITLNASITLPTNFETNFQQSITNDKGKVIKYEGSVKYQNIKELISDGVGIQTEFSRNLFKWNYTNPTKKEVCTDGIQLTVIDHDLEQVSNYLIDDKGINLEEILKVAIPLSLKDYKATYNETEYLITLDKKNQLSQIVYVDELDNGVKIIFSNMHYNLPTFTETLLECNTPKGYDIIEG